MPLTDLDAQLLIVQQVGDVDWDTGDPIHPLRGGNGVILMNIGRLWTAYEDRARFSKRLRDLHVKIAAQELVIGRLEALVSFTGVNGGMTVNLSDRARARQAQLKIWQEDLKRLEKKIFVSGEAAVGDITRTAPILPPLPGELSSPNSWAPDANDPSYSGSPYWRRRSRI